MLKPLTLTLLAGVLLSCAAPAYAAPVQSPLQVSASNTILADIVQNIGGNNVTVQVLLPANADPHTFQPTLRDMVSLNKSRLLFVNGAGLESWLGKVKSGAPKVQLVTLSDGVTLRALDGGTDPHAWWNPLNVAVYAKNAAAVLSRVDPAHKALYSKNLMTYQQKLKQADAQARARISTIPAAQRQLVTNHDSMGYFAQRYGLKVVGNVIDGLSTDREPSTRELAALIAGIKKSHVKALFTENTMNPRLARSISKATGVTIAPPLYTDALSPAGTPGASYLGAFKHNVDVIVGALK